jgi:hypothetical protein
MRRTPMLLVLLTFPLTAQDDQVPVARLLQPADLAARTESAAILAKGLQPAEQVDVTALRAALRDAAERLPIGSAARVRAETLLARATAGDALRLQCADLLADLTFQPFAEAGLPAGVPGYQALDEIERRDYPAYRMVRTGMRGGSIGAFWPLFQHIQQHEIAMTTPVQIDYAADSQRATSMAFLYGAPDLGTVGKSGRVEVVDVPPMTVLTLGSRGYDRPDRITELQGRLTAWLATSRDWEAAGPLRTMGYNSPSVGADRRYFEVQLPIRRRTPAAGERQDV